MKILAFESSCDETSCAVIEDGRKILSDVISTQVGEKEEVRLVLSINDETMIQEQTNFGSRSRNLIIPKGTPLAILVIFKL